MSIAPVVASGLKSQSFQFRIRLLCAPAPPSSIGRAQTDTAVTEVDGKLQDMPDLINSVDESKTFHKQLEEFAKGVQEFIQGTQQEANRTQQAIQALIESTKSDGSSSVLRPGSGHERDCQVFDPRYYKIDVLPSQLQLGIWKKWRHEVEIYIDTINLSSLGVTLLLRLAIRQHLLIPVARR